MSLLEVKDNIVAALPMKGWYVRICVLYTTHYHHHTVCIIAVSCVLTRWLRVHTYMS